MSTKLDTIYQKLQCKCALMRMRKLMEKLEENPYHPVRRRDYPRLFEFRITRDGITYFERLKKEWDEGADLKDRQCLYLSVLHMAYAVYMKSPEECKRWQAFMFIVGETANRHTSEIEAELTQMGCIEGNSQYNPKLYKSHLAWKHDILAKVDSM